MKVKYFILTTLLATLFTGCEVTATDRTNYNYNTYDYDYDLNRYDTQNILETILQTKKTLDYAALLAPNSSPYVSGYLDIIYNDYDFSETLYISSSSKLYLSDPKLRYYSYLKNFTYNYFVDKGSLIYNYDYRGTLENREIGIVTFTTTDDFYGYNHQNPYQGSLRANHNQGTIYLDVVDEYNVNIIFDSHYGGGYDLNFRTTWYALGF